MNYTISKSLLHEETWWRLDDLELSNDSGGTSCPIVLTGDVDLSNFVDAGDVIYVVNDVFKAGPDAQPCKAAGDVDCSGIVDASDIIYLVNKVFKAGPDPCDICAMIPDPWSCP